MGPMITATMDGWCVRIALPRCRLGRQTDNEYKDVPHSGSAAGATARHRQQDDNQNCVHFTSQYTLELMAHWVALLLQLEVFNISVHPVSHASRRKGYFWLWVRTTSWRHSYKRGENCCKRLRIWHMVMFFLTEHGKVKVNLKITGTGLKCECTEDEKEED